MNSTEVSDVLELSLFSGAGGGLLASRLLGWRTVGYVEFDDYCQRVLAARIRDGFLDEAPIFGDIRAFLREGYAEQYRGVADVVSAGFPCQPFSFAGQRRGADDPRNMWPQTAAVLRVVRPRFTFLENVPGLLAGSHGYFGEVLGELAEMGYDAQWCVLGAADLGAPHLRKRLWVAADAERGELWLEPRGSGGEGWEGEAQPGHDGAEGAVAADSNPDRWRYPHGLRDKVADSDGLGCHGGSGLQEAARKAGRDAAQRAGAWWAAEPDVGRVAHGVASRVDRLRAIGNGQVPAVAAAAWRLLSRRGWVR
jgi:DNA (cytosine-5)-methyltransferase 1